MGTFVNSRCRCSLTIVQTMCHHLNSCLGFILQVHSRHALKEVLFFFFWTLFTGASSGIGTETTRVLALRGVHVVMGVRNMTAGKDVKEEIVKEIATAKVDAMELDLSSMDSVKKFASDFNSSGLPLNILM